MGFLERLDAVLNKSKQKHRPENTNTKGACPNGHPNRSKTEIIRKTCERSESVREQRIALYKKRSTTVITIKAQELCENRGGRPGLPSLKSLRFLWK